MSLQMHVRIDGVTGEAKSFKHRGWAEILSWNWGMTSNRKLATNSGDDKTSFNELSLIKHIGSDSSDMRMLYAEAKMIPTAELSIMPVGAKREATSKYLHIVMHDVLIKSIITGGNTEEKLFKEHVTLLFDKVNFEYCKAQAVGESGAETESFDFGWDVAENLMWKQ